MDIRNPLHYLLDLVKIKIEIENEKNLTKAVKTGIVYFVSILSDRKTSNGLVLVSTGVLKLRKPSADSGTVYQPGN